MRTSMFRFVVITVIVGLSATAARIAAQTSRATQNEDVLGALLVEVRGLRAAMEQMASAGPRAHLTLARLQLQDQRVTTMLRRIEAIRDNLATVQADVTEKQNQIASVELALKTQSLPVEKREELEDHLAGLKRDVLRPVAEMQRLTVEEASLANEINVSRRDGQSSISGWKNWSGR